MDTKTVKKLTALEFTDILTKEKSVMSAALGVLTDSEKTSFNIPEDLQFGITLQWNRLSDLIDLASERIEEVAKSRKS
jgi:hypothetical protein